jgi:hypothetical protein
VDAVARLAVGLGNVLDSLELNPLLAQSDRVEALDALAVWATPVGVSERRSWQMLVLLWALDH